MITEEPSYRDLRVLDVHDGLSDVAELIKKVRPTDSRSAVLGISSVAAAFYGVALSVFCEHYGGINVNKFSEEIFFKIGTLKAKELISLSLLLHNDCRDIVRVLVLAINNASPEYVYEIIKYESDFCSIRVYGVDRYLRATTHLGISSHVKWPVLLPFFWGAADGLGLSVSVDAEVLNSNGVDMLDVDHRIRKSATI
ncbi:MAG: hypothetical protein U1F46_02730 [Marinagarivorans sp.]